MTGINSKILKWFESRAISGETLIRMGVYSGAQQSTGDDETRIVAREDGNVICFPFFDRDGEGEVACKYRAAGKKFWQRAGGRKTFFNAQVLDDPALQDGSHYLVITEGEIDALAVVEAGYPFVVSVPDGAPPARDGDGNLIEVPNGTADVDLATDDKFKFIFNNWERLKKIKRIVIAVDNDEPGQRLAAEMVRRLGRVRCCFVAFPEGCKDLDDVLMKHGSGEVNRILLAARPYPVSGVYKLSEFPPEPMLDPRSTGWGRLDNYLRVYYPALMVVTGRANSGKSAWSNQLVANLAYFYDWKCGIASFEMRIRPFVTSTLSAVYRNLSGRRYTRESEDKWMEDNFTFIAPDPQDDEVHDIDWLLDKATAAVIRHGIRVLLIDPWNEIDHVKLPGESSTDYVSRALRACKTFARRYDVLLIVVAHPTKSGAEKNPDEISLYDVSDSAHFANKADLGVVIARLGDPEHDSISSVMVKKVRYQPDTGCTGGRIEFTFDRQARIFSE